MSDSNNNRQKKDFIDGYSPAKKGYQPTGGKVTGGHQPEKSIQKPSNPPKKR